MSTDKRLLRLAREQRANNVNAEAMVWRIVRDRRCAVEKFRRQMPVGDYIVDFMCLECRLVIEIDGPPHEARSSAHEMRSEMRGCLQTNFRVLR
jgi:very-short-patch-repair endonuclease